MVQARPPGRRRTLMLTDLAWARAARAPRPGRARADAPCAAARDRLLEHDRRAAVAASGGDPLRRRRRGQPAGAPRAVAAPARAPQARRRRRCCCRGARARCARRRAEPRARSSRRWWCRSRSSRPGRGGRPTRSATSPAITYAANPPRRGSTACSRRGAPCATSCPEPGELLVAGASEAQLRAAGAAAERDAGVRRR